MSRGVSVPSDAQIVEYLDISNIRDGIDWDDFVANIVDQLYARFPSLCCSDKWIGREDRVYLANRLCYIGISSYGNIASLWVVPRVDTPISRHWIEQIRPRIEAFGQFVRVGTMSNGESVYKVK
jgi:hypothetical protein